MYGEIKCEDKLLATAGKVLKKYNFIFLIQKTLIGFPSIKA